MNEKPSHEAPQPSNTVIEADAIAEEVQVDQPENDRPPDGGYGWVVVFSVFLINAFLWGVAAVSSRLRIFNDFSDDLQSYGVFLSFYISNDVFPEATSLDYAFVGGINFGVAMLAASPVTGIVRRYGTHPPMYAGLLCQSAGYIAASFANRVWQLYLSQGVLVGIGMGLLFIPSVQVTSQWFDKKRSLANGITSSGSGIGGVILSFAIGAAIRNIGLAWALRIIGIVSGGMNLIATLLIRNRNDKIKPAMRGFDYRLLRRLPVLLLLAWGFLSVFGYMIVSPSALHFAIVCAQADSGTLFHVSLREVNRSLLI